MLSLTNHSLAEKGLKTDNKGRFFQKRKSHIARAPNLSLLHSVTNVTISMQEVLPCFKYIQKLQDF